MSLTGSNPNWDSIILRTLFASCLNWSKPGKIAKKKKKIVTLTRHVLRSVCPNGSQKHMHLACCTPYPKWVNCLLLAKKVLPVFYLCIEVRINLAICFPTQNCVVVLLQPFPSLNSYSFLSIHAYKLYVYQIHQQNYHLINFGPLQLFFGLVFSHHILG